jgi:hypothetical protein
MHPGGQTSPLGFEGCAGRGNLLSVVPLRSPMCFPSGVVKEQGTPLRLLLALMQNTQRSRMASAHEEQHHRRTSNGCGKEAEIPWLAGCPILILTMTRRKAESCQRLSTA